MLIDKSKLEGSKILKPEEMMQIHGGLMQEASFHCSCTGADGKTVEKEVSSIEECWNLC